MRTTASGFTSRGPPGKDKESHVNCNTVKVEIDEDEDEEYDTVVGDNNHNNHNNCDAEKQQLQQAAPPRTANGSAPVEMPLLPSTPPRTANGFVGAPQAANNGAAVAETPVDGVETPLLKQ